MDDLNTPATLQKIRNNLLLNRMVGLGANRQQQLREHFHSSAAILSASEQMLDGLPEKLRGEIIARQTPKHADHDWVEAEIERCYQQDIHLLSIECPHYPALLKECIGPPSILYIKGDPLLLNDRQLAVVGGRKASQQAMSDTLQWAQQISQSGICITSGLAEGIDGAAHQGAINGEGKTIAVLAHGLDMIYPKRHQALAERVVEHGALISEFAFGTQPKREFFPRRNRIISGLSEALLVVEAAIKSGSLISARCAIEQNREVFAVPGSIHNPMAAGCLHLIQEGAHVATRADDILETMQWSVTDMPTPALPNNNEASAASPLLNAIPFDAVHLDQLVASLNLSAPKLLGELLLLEASGHIENQSGCYRRIR